MKVLVTGANGYLGLGIVSELLNLGHEVIAADFSTDKCDKRASHMPCNLFDIENPYEYFGKPDTVLHLAWRDGFIHNSESHINDLPLHHAFLKRLFESDIKSVSVMGTMHEVGFFEGSIDENTPCFPKNSYGIAKNALRQDALVMAERFGKKLKWLRAFYIVGNTAYGASIFSKIMQAANDGKTEFPFTTGVCKYDFLDYQEFCRLVSLATVQNEITGIINIASGNPESLASRVERFISDNALNIALEYGAYPERPYDSKEIWGNNQKLLKILKNIGE